MEKYSYEFKKKVVYAYLRGEGSYEYLASKSDLRTVYIQIFTIFKFNKKIKKNIIKNHLFHFKINLRNQKYK